MQAIIEFFTSFGSVLGAFIDWFLGQLESLIWIASTIPTFIASINLAGLYMPSFISGFFGISLSVMAVFAIVKLL